MIKTILSSIKTWCDNRFLTKDLTDEQAYDLIQTSIDSEMFTAVFASGNSIVTTEEGTVWMI